jgi:hypothetical protein
MLQRKEFAGGSISSMGALIIVVFLSLMSFGIFIWYFIAWNLTVRRYSLLAFAARIQPLTGGTFAAILAA